MSIVLPRSGEFPRVAADWLHFCAIVFAPGVAATPGFFGQTDRARVLLGMNTIGDCAIACGIACKNSFLAVFGKQKLGGICLRDKRLLSSNSRVVIPIRKFANRL